MEVISFIEHKLSNYDTDNKDAVFEYEGFYDKDCDVDGLYCFIENQILQIFVSFYY